VAYIGLGANLGDRFAALSSATSALRALPGCALLRCSPWYESSPLGPADQPDYLNGVCLLTTPLKPLQLLHELQTIEAAHGRDRNATGAVRWGARALDLDLLLYGDEVINTARLTVPHPGIASRSFVLQPLYDIAPTLHVPEAGKVSELLAKCEKYDIRPASLE